MCHTKKKKKSTETTETAIEINKGSESQDSEVANAAETLCRTILRYEKCTLCGKSLQKNYSKGIW